MPRRWLWLLLSCCACSSDDNTIEETFAYTDSAGRACQAVLEKARPGSASLNQSVSCEGQGKSCSSESNPCFVLNVDSDTEAIRNCPACCKGSSSSFVGAECSVLVCETEADCVYGKASCVSGLCSCPGGYCE